jgi:hypothetical protein
MAQFLQPFQCRLDPVDCTTIPHYNMEQEKFLINYELEGCQKAVNFLSNYYTMKRLKIILNGRKVGNDCIGCYVDNKAYLKKEGLNKRIVLHEFYHHLIESEQLDLVLKTEEREANYYAKSFAIPIN